MEIYGMTGEKLGEIGAPARSPEKDLPEWKRAFLSTPSVSVRKGIASNYDTPYEDTATLVLTAPSGKFVDIRFPLTYTPSSTSGGTITSHPKFWAFSGTVDTTFLEPPMSGTISDAVTMPYAAHAVFTHDIDSKGSGIVDEGDMFLLPNGDTMEVGIWTNPITGKYEMYKEYWAQPPPRHGMHQLSNELSSSASELRKSPCIVAEVTDSSHGRGIIIRIGDFVQGIYKSADRDDLPVVVGRWDQYQQLELPGVRSRKHESRRNWSDDPRNTGNEDDFPLQLISDDQGEAKVGDSSQTVSGVLWHIVEIIRQQ